MNATQAARELGLNERTIRRALADGRLTAEKRGRSWDLDIEDVRRVVGNGAVLAPYQDALADALQLLRAFDHEAGAEEIEHRYGLVYVAPRASVRAANKQSGSE